MHLDPTCWLCYFLMYSSEPTKLGQLVDLRDGTLLYKYCGTVGIIHLAESVESVESGAFLRTLQGPHQEMASWDNNSDSGSSISVLTEDITAEATGHAQQRMVERFYELRDFQAAKKHGVKERHREHADRWVYKHNSSVFVTNETSEKLITIIPPRGLTAVFEISTGDRNALAAELKDLIDAQGGQVPVKIVPKAYRQRFERDLDYRGHGKLTDLLRRLPGVRLVDDATPEVSICRDVYPSPPAADVSPAMAPEELAASVARAIASIEAVVAKSVAKALGARQPDALVCQLAPPPAPPRSVSPAARPRSVSRSRSPRPARSVPVMVFREDAMVRPLRVVVTVYTSAASARGLGGGLSLRTAAATLEGTTWLASSSAAPAGGKKRGIDGDALRAGRASREPLGDVSWRERLALG